MPEIFRIISIVGQTVNSIHFIKVPHKHIYTHRAFSACYTHQLKIIDKSSKLTLCPHFLQ